MKAGVAAGLAIGLAALGATAARAANDQYVDPEKPALPPSDMKLDLQRTALVVTDPQVDFLSPKGVTWGAVGKSVEKQGTVANIGRLFAAAKAGGITVAVSPHYYYPTDKGWRFEGALEKLMHKIGMFDRKSPYSVEGFEGSGAGGSCRNGAAAVSVASSCCASTDVSEFEESRDPNTHEQVRRGT